MEKSQLPGRYEKSTYPAQSAHGGFARGQMVALYVYGSVVGSKVGGVGKYTFPVNPEPVVEKQMVALESRADNSLTVPSHTHRCGFVVLRLSGLLVGHGEPSRIPREFMLR